MQAECWDVFTERYDTILYNTARSESERAQHAFGRIR